ncbi:MAG TPA: TonB-dependent receptor [Gemmatimonadaceae bacterium]|nr:TonB-dependent receptor [Gemmatimonadaceae bacterium]
MPPSLLAQSSGTVAGRIRDDAGNPVQGATVSLGATQTAVARNDGTYRISAPAGRYTITARLIGFASHTDTINVSAGGITTHDFTLTKAVTALEAVTTLGTRGEARTVIDAPVPIDVLPALEIRSTGRTETAQMIQALAPSFNFPRTTLGDATDNVRPATLRGMSPDQALVLVNGKRRHLSAVVNINGFVGRGSEAVDLNAIPASMIDHIEILRDGAAAQYGSDAIAGVINIVLKTNAPGDFTTQVGEYSTKQPAAGNWTSDISHHDGKLFYTNADKGFSFGQNGYVFVGGEIRDRGLTNRAAPDLRQQYFTGDPKNSNPPQVDFSIGDSYTHDMTGWLNAGTTLASGVQLYAFGGASHRFGDAFGFWRRPQDPTNVRAIYPNGYLPEEQPTMLDASGFGGVKGRALGWDYDLSTGYGRDNFDMNVVHSVNVSMGAASPTDFYAGRLAFGQWTNNLDLFRDVAVGLRSPLHVAWGAEFRVDQYEVGQGDSASWKNGGVPVLDAAGKPTATPAPVGSQVYPGFRPEDAGSHSRNNAAGYIDVSQDITSQLLIDVAGRAEHYSDFGSTTTGKVSGRYEPIKGYALRGAISSGFRAPSLGQEYFSNTAINFVTLPGQTTAQPLEIRTFPVASAEAQALHAQPLKPEKSVNYSAGVAIEPLRNLSATVDYYKIDMKDRIVLSNNFTAQSVIDTLAAHGLTGLGGGRYFTNAVDTKTNGIDVVASYGWTFTQSSVLNLTAGYNGNWTQVTRVDTSSIIPGQSVALFSRADRARLEVGNPRNNLLISGDFRTGRAGLVLRGHRYGQVTAFGTTAAGDQTFGARWVADASLSFGPVRRGTVIVGADNIFDKYPDPTIAANTNSGILPFAGITPFGFNGRFLYAKLSVGL